MGTRYNTGNSFFERPLLVYFFLRKRLTQVGCYCLLLRLGISQTVSNNFSTKQKPKTTISAKNKRLVYFGYRATDEHSQVIGRSAALYSTLSSNRRQWDLYIPDDWSASVKNLPPHWFLYDVFRNKIKSWRGVTDESVVPPVRRPSSYDPGSRALLENVKVENLWSGFQEGNPPLKDWPQCQDPTGGSSEVDGRANRAAQFQCIAQILRTGFRISLPEVANYLTMTKSEIYSSVLAKNTASESEITQGV